eukprot:TRINITY_DN1478_c0_g5_i1.p1 TRINITY_DN1478_c0_g5~~TRINITY_DN1478_c0_g5_i1.p1  ORF type:complete len:649 (+),score=170.97 TRINITY_DN1478_c0_g5_i1:44-1948(+)
MRPLVVALGVLWACATPAAGNTFDCSSCRSVKADAGGVMACSCEMELTSLDINRKGNVNITGSECSGLVTVEGVIDGNAFGPQEITGDEGITIETLDFCEDGGLVLLMKDLYFAEGGIHFCPHLRVCNALTINNDRDWCTTIAEQNSCLAHRTCGECLADHPDEACVWCNRTFTCVRKAPAAEDDLCGVCGAEHIITRQTESTCPKGTKDIPVDTKDLCGGIADFNECLLESCEWKSGTGCTAVGGDTADAEGNTLDCSSCESVEAEADGTLRCHCVASVEVLGLAQSGNVTIVGSECSDTVTISGWWNGDRINPQEVSNDGDGVRVEELPLCASGLRFIVHDLYFTSDGIHMCPELKICDLVTINHRKDWCVLIHESNSCLAHDSCGECLKHQSGGEKCVWCTRTNTCVRQDAADPTKDTCRMCGGHLHYAEDIQTCPAGGNSLGWQTGDAPCSDVADFTDCVSSSCEWKDSSCVPIIDEDGDEGEGGAVQGPDVPTSNVNFPHGRGPPPSVSGLPVTLVPPGSNFGGVEPGSASDKFAETANRKHESYGGVMILMLLLFLGSLVFMTYRIKKRYEEPRHADAKIAPSETMSEPSRDLRDVCFDANGERVSHPRPPSQASVFSADVTARRTDV